VEANPCPKGNRPERAIVKFLQNRGFAAERVPLSGSAGALVQGRPDGAGFRVDRVVEVKCRADGFREFYKWLQDRDILIVRADRSEPLVVLIPLFRKALEILRGQFPRSRTLLGELLADNGSLGIALSKR
jgi:hypothetical protein